MRCNWLQRHLADDVPTLVLYGDVPLTQVDTFAPTGVTGQDERSMALLTVNLDNSTGYGRIVRDAQGNVCKIVEQKDATPDELAIHEVNTGILVAPTPALKRWLSQLSNQNAQGEYYLTDVDWCDGGSRWTAGRDRTTICRVGNAGRQQQSAIGAIGADLSGQIAQQLLEQGVGLSDPARIDVRGKLVCGMDVSIDVNCVFEGQVQLGDGTDCVNCVIRNAQIAKGTQVAPFTHIDGATVGAGAKIEAVCALAPPEAILADHTHGEFCRNQETVLGTGSKVNHLA